jgi:uncharacterized protein
MISASGRIWGGLTVTWGANIVPNQGNVGGAAPTTREEESVVRKVLCRSGRFGWAISGIVVTLGALLAPTACNISSPPGGGDRISIATGGTGGVYYVYGGALADQITRNLDEVEATAESTSASVDNMLLIDGQSSDVAFTLADTAADAVEGREDFEEPVPAQALAQLYTNYTQVVAPAGSGIRDIEDLRDKSVSVGSPGSGTEVIALRVLEAAGIDPDSDIERQQLGVDESVDAVRDGTLDAFFWSGGLPTGAITDLATTDSIVLLPTDAYLGALREEYGEVYQEATIPAGTYEGFDQDTAVIGVPNYLVVNQSMDEGLAHDITQLLFDQQDALAQAHPEARNLDINVAPQVPPLELHPGARRYYDEAGS